MQKMSISCWFLVDYSSRVLNLELFQYTLNHISQQNQIKEAFKMDTNIIYRRNGNVDVTLRDLFFLNKVASIYTEDGPNSSCPDPSSTSRIIVV